VELRNSLERTDRYTSNFGIRGQQEIAGFVLIVVVVMIALMVFLIISVRDAPAERDSLEVSNMIGVLMRTTSECAIIYEPDYDKYEDLFKSCYKGSDCSNLGESACDYLNESLNDVVDALMRSEANIKAYEIEFFVKDGESILKWESGNCSGVLSGAQRSIISQGESLIVRMKICTLV